jgi:hypothetical protein
VERPALRRDGEHRPLLRPPARGHARHAGGTSTIPWGPSPLPRRTTSRATTWARAGTTSARALGRNPGALSQSGRRPVLSRPELVSPAAAAASQTTGAIRSPRVGEPTVVAGSSRARRGDSLDAGPRLRGHQPRARRAPSRDHRRHPAPSRGNAPANSPPALGLARSGAAGRASPERRSGSASSGRLAGAEHSFARAPLAPPRRGPEGHPDARDPRRRPPAVEGEPRRPAARAVALARAARLGHAREPASDHALARRRSGPPSWCG